VTRVGEQRKRVSDDPRGDLGRHQQHDEQERDRQRATVGYQPVFVFVGRA
jgi:hypothetical protein